MKIKRTGKHVKAATSTKRKFTVKASKHTKKTMKCIKGETETEANERIKREEFAENLIQELENEYSIKVSNSTWGKIIDLADDLDFGKEAEKYGSTPFCVLEHTIYDIIEEDTGTIIGSTQRKRKFTVKASKSAKKSKIMASHIDNPRDIEALTDYINDVADTMMSVSYAYYNNSEDWEVHLYMDSDEVRSDFMHFIEMQNPTVYKSVIEDPDVIDTYSGDCELYNNGPAYFPIVIEVDIEHGYDKELVEDLKHLRDEYRKYLNRGLNTVQNVLGDFLAPLGNSDIKSSSSIRKKRISAKTSKSVRKSKIMAGGTYPEYLEDKDACAERIEQLLKEKTGIDFYIDNPDSIEYVASRNYIPLEIGWFKLDVLYNLGGDYEPLESYMGEDTPLINKFNELGDLDINMYSDISIEDSEDLKHGYWDGLSIDVISDYWDDNTDSQEQLNKETTIIGNRICEKIYEIRDDIAKIMMEYVVPEDDEYIEESTSVGKKNIINAVETNITASTGDAVDVNEVKDILWNAGFSETEVKETRTHLGTEYKILIGGAGEEKPELEGSSIIDTLRSAGYTVEFDTVAEGWMYLFITDNRTEPKYLYRVSYDYTSDIVEMDDETSDYQAVIDKLIDNMESTGNTGYLISPDEAEAEYSEDMYTIGGNHGLALIHNGNLNIEPLGWSNEVDTQYDTVHSSTNISCSEDNEIIWEPIPESIDDAGKPTTWSTSVNGEFFWISKKPNGRYDVERNQNGRYIPVSDELANLGSLYDAEKEFDEWLEESDINSATDIKAAIGGKSSSTDDFEYYKALADKVVEYANTYFDNLELTNLVYDISDKMLTFTDIAGGRNEIVYIIPLENITPNWEDLESDADELYESMMGSLLPF